MLESIKKVVKNVLNEYLIAPEAERLAGKVAEALVKSEVFKRKEGKDE